MGASLSQENFPKSINLHFQKLILNLTRTERKTCTSIVDLLSYSNLNDRSEFEVRHNATSCIMVIELSNRVSYQPTNNRIQNKEINFFY